MPTRLEVDIKIRIVKEDGHPEQGGIQGAIDIYRIVGENNNIEQIYNMISEYKEFISQLNVKKGVANHNFIAANEEEAEVTESSPRNSSMSYPSQDHSLQKSPR